MEKIATKLPGVFILEPKVFGDYRGYFMETYSAQTFGELDVDRAWVQDNQSFTQKKGTHRMQNTVNILSMTNMMNSTSIAKMLKNTQII